MSPQFFAALRTVDALVHVVRGFKDDTIPHVEETLDPARDAAALELEFALADLQIVENRLKRLQKEARTVKTPALAHEQEVLTRCRTALEDGLPLRDLEWDSEDEKQVRGFRFLTLKPLLIVLNIGEDALGDASAIRPLERWQTRPKTGMAALCAKMEMELAQLEEEEAQVFRADLGIEESALSKMVRLSYELLGLRTFFTASETEVKAWTLPAGSTALDAAGTIHSDLARGFIRAETVFWEELVRHGSYGKVRDAGLLRLEGKEYPVQDGEVLVIRFNV